MKPLAIDLCCGLGGWTEGLLAEGWDVVGFDIERHAYGSERYPAQLVLQDILTIDGRQFRGKASLIVASPPCQEYSYMAMPWSRAKAIAADYRSGVRDRAKLTALFDACVRIGREAECPIVIENVRGAQPWVGKARANYGSFYLWGQVPILMPKPHKARKVPGFRFDGSGKSFQTASVEGTKVAGVGAGWKHPSDPRHVPGLAFNTLSERAQKTEGHVNRRDGHSHTRHLTNQAEHDAVEGRKQKGSGREWFAGEGTIGRTTSSKSSARKAASARIAKIPPKLSAWIARYYFPESAERAS